MADIYGSWKEYLKALEAEFIGKHVMYEGLKYTIVKIDCNGIIHINKPGRFNETTAVYEPHDARLAMVK